MTAPVAVRLALPTDSVPRFVAAALVVREAPVTLPETSSVWPVAVSVVAPVVVRTAVVPRVLVNWVAAPVRVAVPVTALFCVRVTAWPAALTVRAPAPVRTPLCVTAPVAVRFALPTLSVPRFVAAALVVSEAPVTLPETSSVWPVAVSVVAPVVVRTAVVPRVLVNWVAAPVREAVPVTALFCVRVTAWPAALTVRAPASVRTPLCVTAPVAVRFALPTLSVPSVVAAALVVRAPVTVPLTVRALVSVRVTSLPEVMTTALKLFALSRVMSLPVPAASVVVPVTVSAPESVSAPPVVTPRVPEMVEVPRARAPVSFSVTLLPLVMTTVPKLLAASSSVMLLAAPAARVAEPETVRVPVSVTAPAVESEMFWAVTAGKATPPAAVLVRASVPRVSVVPTAPPKVTAAVPVLIVRSFDSAAWLFTVPPKTTTLSVVARVTSVSRRTVSL